MTVKVVANDEKHVYLNLNDFVVTDDGRLHVLSEGRTLGVFNTGVWQVAEVRPDAE